MNIRKLLGLVLTLISVSAMASGAPSEHARKSWTLTLSSPTRVGTALLPAGDYKVQQFDEGETHQLVFKADKKELARVNCVMETLPSKIKNASITFDQNSAGERVLVGIVFAGDMVRHELKR